MTGPAKTSGLLAEGRRLFGTDGVRGVANVELTAELATAIGRAAASPLKIGPVLVGRDTRRSGEMLSMALQAGIHSAGIDTLDVGVLPSGGISRLTSASDSMMGAVVSASHNPADDNGIKLLDGSGRKLSDSDEDSIEAAVRLAWNVDEPAGGLVGTRFPMPDALDRYVADLSGLMPYSLRGIDLALDCANGAAYQAAPRLFEGMHADVEVHWADPDGTNINENSGAVHPEHLARLIDGRIGFCFDGDADRVIAVDEEGGIVNGDGIMAIIARHLAANDRLPGRTVVSTVMSNLGFRKSMNEADIRLVETRVGDRYVLEAMKEHGASLGGEQSGHVIFLDDAVVGDGLLTALRLLEVVAATGSELRELADQAIVQYPQILRNVRIPRDSDVEKAAPLWEAVAAVEANLGSEGRVLVRPSGTEPLLRIMVEAASRDDALRYAEHLIDIAAREFGEV